MLKRIIASIIFTIASSSIITYALGSGTWAYGDVFMKNGDKLDSVNFHMPLVQDTKVKVKINDKSQTIPADSIEYIILWSEKHPEEKHIIKSFIIKNVSLETGEVLGYDKKPIWLVCREVGENASIWASIGRPSFKRGHLQLNYNKIYSYVSKWYVLKKGEDNPCHVPNSEKDEKKWIMVFFADDPALVKRTQDGEYNRSDWGYKYIDTLQIVCDYNPANNE